MKTVIDIKSLAAAIGAQLAKHRSALVQETRLHEVISEALTSAGFAHQREVRLAPTERLDFLLTETGVAIEVKKDKATMDAWRQVARYLAHDCVSSCIVIAPRVNVPADTLQGKPVAAIALWKFLL